MTFSLKEHIRLIKYQILFLFIISLFISSCNAEERVDYNPRAEFENHTNKMPEPVWRLFYAIKHDLDYGVIGEDPGPRPQENILDYKSVNTELLNSVKASFTIFEYTVKDMDYKLELRSINNNSERYLATRSETFIWKRDKWVSIGGYIYL